jgi:hydrogenase expression/formation protein HypC
MTWPDDKTRKFTSFQIRSIMLILKKSLILETDCNALEGCAKLPRVRKATLTAVDSSAGAEALSLLGPLKAVDAKLHRGENLMCLAIPGRVVSIEGTDPAFRNGNVDFCGVLRKVNLAFTPDVALGDFVLVHVGFALTRIDEDEAARTYQYLAQIGALEEEGLAPGLRDAGGAPS